MKAHALLSPSGASRWLACTPSARLEKQFPDSAGEAAREGTLAHSLGELILRKETKQITMREYSMRLGGIEANELYNNAMYLHATDYADFVLERFAAAKARTKDALLEIEVKLDLRDYIEQGFGTGDAIIIADGTLEIIDLKYGKGVLVEATENKQMMLYGLGALIRYSCLYDIQTVCMTIFQPRLENFSIYELPVPELLEWAKEVLKPLAALAYDGLGKYNPGEHCRFCRAKAVCKAHADYQLEIARHDFKSPDLITDEDISDILSRTKDFKTWLTSVEDYALASAVNDGKKWPGYKLVEGRSNRVITDESKVAKKLEDLKYSEADIWNKKIKGITDLEKLLGKKEFATQLGKWVLKPDGKPTLAPITDKRPELNSTASAKSDFENVNIS